MPTLNVGNIPDDLYQRLQDLAASQHRSISAQVISLLEKALPKEAQQTEDERRQNVAKLLEESRRRRQSRRTDVEWPDSTAMIREDRDR